MGARKRQDYDFETEKEAEKRTRTASAINFGKFGNAKHRGFLKLPNEWYIGFSMLGLSGPARDLLMMITTIGKKRIRDDEFRVTWKKTKFAAVRKELKSLEDEYGNQLFFVETHRISNNNSKSKNTSSELRYFGSINSYDVSRVWEYLSYKVEKEYYMTPDCVYVYREYEDSKLLNRDDTSDCSDEIYENNNTWDTIGDYDYEDNVRKYEPNVRKCELNVRKCELNVLENEPVYNIDIITNNKDNVIDINKKGELPLHDELKSTSGKPETCGTIIEDKLDISDCICRHQNDIPSLLLEQGVTYSDAMAELHKVYDISNYNHLALDLESILCTGNSHKYEEEDFVIKEDMKQLIRSFVQDIKSDVFSPPVLFLHGNVLAMVGEDYQETYMRRFGRLECKYDFKMNLRFAFIPSYKMDALSRKPKSLFVPEYRSIGNGEFIADGEFPEGSHSENCMIVNFRV